MSGFNRCDEFWSGREFVDLSVDVDEFIEAHVDVAYGVDFEVREEICHQVMFGGTAGVHFRQEDFGHVGEAFCEEFDRLFLPVSVVETLNFQQLGSHFQAEFVRDPCRFVGESLECRALPDSLGCLQRDRDPAGGWAVGRIVLRLQEEFAFAVELGEGVEVTQSVVLKDGSLLRVVERPHEGFDFRGGRCEGRCVCRDALEVDVGCTRSVRRSVDVDGVGDRWDGGGGSARCVEHRLVFEAPCIALVARSRSSMRRGSGGHGCLDITLLVGRGCPN